MKPTFDLFGLAVPTYSVMMTLGFALALWVVFRQVHRSTVPEGEGGLTRAQVWDLFIVMVVASVIGSKVGHVLFESTGHLIPLLDPASGQELIGPDGQPRTREATGLWDLLKADPWHWARLGEGGYVWYGGLIGALLTAAFYFWRRPHLNAWLYSDAFAPAIAAGAIVGRLGCFLAGCCYGIESSVPWAVHFPGVRGHVHPTQLYDAMGALILAVPLYWRFPRRRFDGEIIALLLMGYAVLRSFTEAFRGDEDRGLWGPLSTSQLLSIPMFLAGLALYLLRSRRATATPAGDSSRAAG